MNQKIYLESTIASYYTARPSADAIKAARQAATIRWFEKCASECDCYISRYVIDENSKGDYKCPKILTPAEFMEVYNVQ